MNAGNQAIPGQQETALLDYVQRLSKSAGGRQALHLRMSALRPSNRDPQRLEIAAQAFEALISGYDGAMFRLHNGDFVVFCKDASPEITARAVTHLKNLFIGDPAVADDGPGSSEFYRQFDLARAYSSFVEFARGALESARQPGAANGGAAPMPAPARPKRALDPKVLGGIQTAIARADLSNVIRRQSVCAVAPGKPPLPVFSEVFTSIAALRDVLTPDIDIHGNRWLFQDLTTHLDRRVLSFLGHKNDSTLSKAFSINLNVASLASPEFLAFDQKLSSEIRKTVVIELQLFDVLADLDTFVFTRNFLRERSYRFCLDGLTYQTLPVINCKRLGVDLVKIIWSPELHQDVTRKNSGVIEAVKALGPNRVILIRCDDKLAFETGKALGTSLYQGYLIDRMLKQGQAKASA